MGIEDHYTIYLRNYCYWTGQGKQYNTCTRPETYFWFDPVTVWGQKGTNNIVSSASSEFHDGLDTYRSGSKDMLSFFYAALTATGLTLLMGITAIFSRWGSFLATLCATAAAITYCGATAVGMGVAGIMQDTMNKELEDSHNIKTQYGKSIIYTNGLGCIVSVAASFFWFLSVFCFSGRSPYNERDRRGRGRITAEKTPYTYEKLAHSNQGNSNHHIMRDSQPVTSAAYEPFRHTGAGNV